MGLYLGSSKKQKISINGTKCHFNIISLEPTNNNVGLISSDNYILMDLNGLYIVPKETQSVINGIAMSSDNYILKDKKGTYLTIKEEK